MNILLILPILIPFLAAILVLLARKSRRIQRLISIVGMAVTLSVAIGLLFSVLQNGIQAAQMGTWKAPFGITLGADLLSAITVVLAALMGLVITIYSLATVDEQRESFRYYPLLNVLLMGICGTFLTGIFSTCTSSLR